MMIERVAVLGLDALSWRYVEKIIRINATDTLKWIFNRSSNMTLKAEFPPFTFPSWTSIMTGVNPGKHGIFAFDYVDLNNLEHRLCTALDLMHPRIHEILAYNNIPSIMINPIPSFPVIPIKNSYIISHMFFVDKPHYSPKNLGKVVSGLPGHPIIQRTTEFVHAYIRILDHYVSIVEELITNTEWRLFWITLNFPDVFLHHFPEMMNDFMRFEEVILRKIDRIASLLLKHSDAIFIVSDHGFAKYNYAISLNDVLVNLGLAKISYGRRKLRDIDEMLFRRMSTCPYREHQRRRISLIFSKIVYSPIFYPLRRVLKPILINLPRAFRLKLIPTIYVDPQKSLAFVSSSSSFGIYLKKMGIENSIISYFRKLGGIKWAKKREEVYSGPYIHRAPQIFVCPDYRRKYFIAKSKIYGREIVRREFVHHHPDGIFSMFIKKNPIRLELRELHARNVTPLIIGLMGVPISKMADDIDLLRNILSYLGEKLSLKNYSMRWRITRSLRSTNK